MSGPPIIDETLGAPETCPYCEGPMTKGFALANTGKGCVSIALPPHCPSEECRRQRDDEAIADAIARGVIDP